MIVRKDEEYQITALQVDKAVRAKRTRQKVSRGLLWTSWIAFACMVAALCIFVSYVGVLSFLPLGYYALLLIFVVALCTLMFLALRLQKKPAATSVICLLMSIVMFFTSIIGVSALRFIYKNIDKTNDGSYTTTIVVSVYVRTESSYQTLSDLRDKTFGVRLDEMNDTISRAIDQLKTILDNQLTIQEYNDYAELVQALKSGVVDALVMDQALLSNITESFDGDFEVWARKLPVELKVEQNIQTQDVSVSKAPFIVYISGLDTRGGGPIRDTGLSDVNQIAVVNPVAKKILLVNTPRDTYVPLIGDTTKMDKLTHAGIYGINCSMVTLERLYDIRFNYYVRVNFQSVVNIIDALGGITVESDYNFSSGNSLSGTTYHFYKGANYLTGDKALAFARQRQGLSGGDMQRGVHQQRIIAAVLKKLMTATVISNFPQVLTAITENTKTNISSEDINELIQMQLSDMASWDIQTYAMFGTGTMGTLYTFGTSIQYGVLEAPEDQVAEIKSLIAQTMNAHK